MQVDVEVLEFRVPVENNKTLFVWDIKPGPTEAQIHEELFAVFSSFGPLYLLKVNPNAPQQPPGFYAIVKFYSAAQAAAAQRSADGQRLLDSSTLKVRLSSKQTPHFLSGRPRPLSHAHCLRLANHLLGFNGWTSDIITLKELPAEEEEEEDEEEEEEEEEEQGERRGERPAAGRRRTLRLGCLLQLSFPQHGRSARGAAVVKDSFTCSGPEVELQRRCRLQKQVRESALVQAFSSVLLILLGNGKVMVELRHTDQMTDDQTEGLLQVNEFSWIDVPADEDEAEDEEWT
ncbi:RAD52 motif-containing protein 1 [Salarias fasciatus]|uniref:RAD52 motif-containing protein 1 n=1 Tax=Salarias fasciatus TaxID=181472 RepID=UPI0011766D0D|nr:RAD52 motif-containing protein 1 [Salarias fasciatus]